jgi:TANFOR domain-containing protein
MMKTMLQYLKKAACLLSLFCVFHLNAQVIVTSVTVNPPYDPDLFNYTLDPSKVLISVTNTSASTQNIKLGATFQNVGGSVTVATSPDYQPPQPLTLAPGETRLLTANDLGNLFPDQNSIISTGIDRDELIRTRRVPAGIYQLCVTAYNYASSGHTAPLSATIPAGCSPPFRITIINAPEITTIGTALCGGVMETSSIQNFLMLWIAPPEIPSDIRYIIEMIELVPNDRNPMDAFESATTPIFFRDSVSSITSYLYTEANPRLEIGKKYAVRIRIVDPAGGLRFANRGYSVPCTFTYGSSTGGRFTLASHFPNNNEYIPWRYFPITVRFSPYDNDLFRFNFNLNLLENGVSVLRRTEELRWPWGPAESQTRATGMTIIENASRTIPVNESNASVGQEFLRGAHYQYDVNGYFLHRSTGESQQLGVTCTDNFISGMGVPVNQSPANLSRQNRGMVALRFQTADFPANFLPPFSVVTSGTSASPAANFFNHGVEERYVLEVSRDNAFNDIVHTVSRRFAPNVSLTQCIADNNLLNDSIYRSIEHSFEFTQNGTYYWRVKWLEDDADRLSRAYVTGPVWQFTIGDAPPETIADTTRRTSPSCIANCTAPAITDRIQVATAVVGNTIKVGKFDMVLTEITWTGVNARGRGTIRVPFMNAPVRVSFTSIQINASNELLLGDVLTETDNTTLIPDALARASGPFTGLSPTQGQEINEWITTAGRLASQLAGSAPVGMPLGIDNTVDGQRLTIGIMGCKFTSTTATLNALVSLDIPELHGWLSLGANDICFHPGGLNMGQGKLFLPMDRDLAYTDDIRIILKAQALPRDSGTYVSWDCAGFRELAISGLVRFGRNLFLPDALDGTVGPGQVEGRFAMKVQRQGNWMSRLDMDPFQVAGLPEWGFTASEAYLDFSDLQNAASMTYPEGYGGDNTIMWKGFYMKRLAVRLPNKFKTFGDPTQRISGSVNNMLIDGTGFSGRFAIENLIRVEDGNLDGWAYSLDSVYLSMVSNNFRNAGLTGEVRLPISASDELKYNASLNRSSAGAFSFEFRIQPKDTLQAQIWETSLSLLPTSRISVVVDGAGFAASSDLSGSLSISGSRGGRGGAQIDGMGFRGISFEHFVINSRGPNYISVGSFARASAQHSAGGFPLSITNINITSRSGPSLMEFDQSPGARFGIEFVVALNLTGESGGFRAAGKIALLGKLSLTGERQGWTFSGVNLDSIAVGGDIGPVRINGSLAFYNSHPVYGKGIKGYLSVGMQPTINVEATVQFGEVNGFRYWYVDAMATWSPGVTLFTGVDLRGLGGGAWYHMRAPEPVSFSRIPASGVGGAGARTATRPTSETPGATSTGGAFTPDGSIGLGFQLKVKVGATSGSSAYHGLITLGAQFVESTGGMESIFLRGDFIIMSESDNRATAAIAASVDIRYNFVTSTFQTNVEVFVNIADVLVGVNPNNMAGHIEIFASPQKWYIYVGKPDVPVGLALQLGSTRLARASFYFMCGMDLPPMPPLPDKIARALNINIERDVTNLARGDGFAMGTNVQIGPLGIEIMPFYARLDLEFGFDLSVKKYTQRCEGMAAGETLGENGWYARGQIYGYLDASLGLFVDLFFVKGRFEILGVSIAAYLQGGFPNPNWVEGAMAGSYNILNGAVQGNCHFQFSQGQKCVPPVENPMAGMELVAALSPDAWSSNVDCGVEPSALYNYSINQEFCLTVKDMNNNDVVKRFRVLEKETRLKPLTSRAPYVEGTLGMSENNSLLTFYPDSFLASRRGHLWETTAYVEEQKNGVWATSRDLEDRLVQKKYAVIFVTGDRPDKIDPRHVAYSYPFQNQRYFLQDECKQGVVALKRSMHFLFTRAAKTGYAWQYKARFTPLSGGEPVLTDLRNYTTTNITFDIPTLTNNKIYKVDFIAMRVQTGKTTINDGFKAQNTSIKNTYNMRNFGNSSIQTRSKSLTAGSKTGDDLVILYTFHFKTSQYNTIATKFAAMTTLETNKVSWGDLESITHVATGEGFDEYDVKSHTFQQGPTTRTIPAMVSFDAEWTPRTNIWMERQQYATYAFRDYLVSGNFSTCGLTNTNFRTRRYGTPPKGPVSFSDDYRYHSLLTDSEILPPPPSNGFRVSYGLPNLDMASQIGMGLILEAMRHRIPIFYGVTTQTFLNRNEARNMARTIVANCGLWGSEFLTPADQVYLDYVLNQPYTRLTFGNYPVKVYFNSPTCGTGPDFTENYKFNVVLPIR